MLERKTSNTREKVCMTDRSNNIIMPVMEFLFSIISVLLMLPLVEQTAQEEYYRVIFIYLIRFVLKSISDKPKPQCLFLKTWSFVNLVLGIMATALSFGLMKPLHKYCTICLCYIKSFMWFLWTYCWLN